jgi:hypothetical protein
MKVIQLRYFFESVKTVNRQRPADRPKFYEGFFKTRIESAPSPLEKRLLEAYMVKHSKKAA